MASTYTTATGLEKPANGDDAGSWDTPVRANYDLIDAYGAIFMFGVQTTEHPSASLNVRIQGGTYYSSLGLATVVATNTSMGLTTAATNYIYIADGATTFSQNTTGFPAGNNVPVAIVVAGATTITSITDARRAYRASGATASLPLAAADASAVVVVTAGTTNGVQLAASATNKLGFYGATPIVRPSSANETALTDSTGGTPSATLAAIAAGSSYAQADMVAVKNALSGIAVLLNQIRLDLVNLGLVKGSA